MSKKLNIIEAMKMPIGTEFEVLMNGDKYGCVAKILKSNVQSKKQLVWDNRANTSIFITDSVADATFIPIQQPVSFMEVVNSDKKCRVEHKLVGSLMSAVNIDFSWLSGYDDLEVILHEVAKILKTNEFKQLIKEGKWYIEESEELEDERLS